MLILWYISHTNYNNNSDNKTYVSITVNFRTGIAKETITLQLKFMENKRYHEKRTAHRYLVTSISFKPLKQHLAFRNHFIPDPLFKSTNNFGFVFRNLLDTGIYETKFTTRLRVFPPPLFFICNFSNRFNFFFELKTFCLWM